MNLPWPVLGIASAVFAALVAILGKLGLENVSPIAATAARAMVMAVATVLVAAASGELAQVGGFTARSWIFIGLSGVAGAASWLAFFAALKAGSAAQVSALDRLSLAFVVVLAAVFLGEGLTWSKSAGAVLVVAGAWLIAR